MSNTTVDTDDVPSVESIAKLYNTYGLATRGFVWNAIGSVSGDWGKGYVKTVNDVESDENGNVSVSAVSSIDYAGDLNQINSDLSAIIGGEDGHRILTDIDDKIIRRDVEEKIDSIKSIIPTEATEDNKLADKEYVGKTIRKELPTFRGSWTTWGEVPVEGTDYPQDCDGNSVPKSNDFIVVFDSSGYSSIAKVSVGIVGRPLAEAVLDFEVGHIIEESDIDVLLDNGITNVVISQTGAWRFIYVGIWDDSGKSGWTLEHELNRTAFTQEQWDAINSKVTSLRLNVIESTLDNCADTCTHIGSLTGRWEGASKEIITISPQTRKVNTVVEDTSGRWNEATYVVNACSGKWNDIDTLISSSVDWNNLLDNVVTTSGNWNSVYTIVDAHSGKWEGYDTDITTLSGDINSLILSSGEWNTTSKNVETSANNWNAVYAEFIGISGDIKTLKETSGKWDSTSDSVSTSGANWNSAYNFVDDNGYKLNQVYSITQEHSGKWEDAVNSIEASSAKWDDTTSALEASGNSWNSTKKTLESLSGEWNTTSKNVETSANKWNTVYADVSSNLWKWNHVYSITSEHSGKWEDGSTKIDDISEKVSELCNVIEPVSANWNAAAFAIDTSGNMWSGTYESVKPMSGRWNSISDIEMLSGNWANAADKIIEAIYLGETTDNNKFVRDNDGNITLGVGTTTKFGVYKVSSDYGKTTYPSGNGNVTTIDNTLYTAAPTYSEVPDEIVSDKPGVIRPSFWPTRHIAGFPIYYDPSVIDETASLTKLDTYVDDKSTMYAIAKDATAEQKGVVQPPYNWDMNTPLSGIGLVYTVFGKMFTGKPCFKEGTEYAGVVSPTNWLDVDANNNPVIPDGYTNIGTYIDERTSKIQGLVPYANNDTYGIVKIVEDDSTVNITYKTTTNS